jgi:hypothetical protein
MQRKEPLEKKGVAGMDALAVKNILTRRANHWHIFIIPQFGKLPAVLRNSALRQDRRKHATRWLIRAAMA